MSTRPSRSFLLPRATLLAAAILAVAVAGCSIKVRSAELSEDASYFWLGSTSSEPKTIYDTTDEQVTLHVRFHPNFVGQYRSFTVEWIGPDGTVYLADPVGTKYGSNEALIATLPIAGNEPSRMPGRWGVRLLHGSEELLRRTFTIDPPPGSPAP